MALLRNLAGSKEWFWKVYQNPSLPVDDDLAGRILKILRRARGSATKFEIQTRVGVPPDGLDASLGLLVKRGMVTKKQVGRRHVVVSLTPMAKRMVL